MVKKPVDLGFYCLGNGLTIADRNRMEYGDYKRIAHIQPWGKITWSVRRESLPADDVLTIERHAARMKGEYLAYWHKLPLIDRYDKLLNAAPAAAFLASFQIAGLANKVAYLEKAIWER